MPVSKDSSGLLEAPHPSVEPKKPSKVKKYVIISAIVCGIIIIIAAAVLYNQKSFDAIKTTDEKNEFEQITSLAPQKDKCEQKRRIGYIHLEEDRMLTMEQYSRLTHVIMDPVRWYPNGTVDKLNDLATLLLETIKLKAETYNVKIMLAMYIFPEMDWFTEEFRKHLMDPVQRKKIIASIVQFVVDHKLHGIDVDWLFSIKIEEGPLIIDICKDFRKAMAGKPLLLSLGVLKDKVDIGYNEILKYVDFLNIHTDDYYSHRHKDHPQLVGPPAPLYGGHPGIDNVDSTLKYFSCLTKQPNRLNMKLNFVANIWDYVNKTDDLWPTAEIDKNGRVYGDFKSFRKVYQKESYRRRKFNNESKTMYITDFGMRQSDLKDYQQTYLAFDGEDGLFEKIRYAIDKNIGGFTILEPDLDDSESNLLSHLRYARYCIKNTDYTSVEYDCESESKQIAM